MAQSKTGRFKMMKINMPKSTTHWIDQKLLQHKTRCVSTLIKPLRIFQFFAVLLLFTFTIYIIVLDPAPISIVYILLIVLSGVYVFVLAVELISHFAGGALHIMPMTIFSLLGLLFFGITGILLIWIIYSKRVIERIVATTLCLLAALFFLIDITMVLAFWKRKCSVCKRCCDISTTELLQQKDEKAKESETKIMRHDVTTSLSDVRVPRELEDIATPDHCYRKVEYPRRREYVDCPTSVSSLRTLDVAQIQTEPKKVSVVESQTSSVITKETSIQTVSKCEFCHQQIQLPLPAIGQKADDTRCFPQTSQWSYPAIVQFVRGGVSAPCCSGCKCTTETPQKQQHAVSLTPKLSETSSETAQQVTSAESENDNIRRLTTERPTITASFYEPDKTMQTVSDVVYKEKVVATLITEDAKPTSKNSELSEKVKIKNKKTETVKETILEHENVKSEDNMKGSDEENATGNNEIERSKGGEHYRIYQEFMRARERGSLTNLMESPMHTNRMLVAPLSGRTKPRPFLQLKSNKVDPIKNANVFDEDCSSEGITPRITLDDKNKHPTRTGSSKPAIEHQSLTPTSDNAGSRVFKDKKGKYFCELCAPLDSKKITSRFDGTDLRKLWCTNCRLHLRDRSVRTNVKPKSDASSKYGRSQRHAASPSST